MDCTGYNGGECSQPKKPKSSVDETQCEPQWAYLPSVVLQQVFDYVSHEDRKSASCVCRHWRQILFHPKWWPTMRFTIGSHNATKTNFLTTTFGGIVSHATVKLNSLSPLCLRQFRKLLRSLAENNHLSSLVLEPTHCHLDMSEKLGYSSAVTLNEIVNLLLLVTPKLSEFNMGCLSDLESSLHLIFDSLNALKVTQLGLASIKDPTEYTEGFLDVESMDKFSNLQILSIDYDHLSDAFLYHLEGANQLKRLVVHLHEIPSEHSGTSNAAWKDFRVAHPECYLRLSVIHSYDDIANLHNTVLREAMPITHIKVFFCEHINMDMLQVLSVYYSNTLRSVVWVDSLSDTEESWKCANNGHHPDPFVIMSWQCLNFEELVLYGYKYIEYNLMAIGRLRGSKMKNIEIPDADILFSDVVMASAVDDISENIKQPWRPVNSYELHPVLTDPDGGDSGEFMLPYVLADLQ